jgi:hypothetical protein
MRSPTKFNFPFYDFFVIYYDFFKNSTKINKKEKHKTNVTIVKPPPPETI